MSVIEGIIYIPHNSATRYGLIIIFSLKFKGQKAAILDSNSGESDIKNITLLCF